jgi:hypothetical protein
MQGRKRYFILTVIFMLLVVFPIVSFLLVRQGYLVRKNAEASDYIQETAISLPEQDYISQRGDTLTPSLLAGKVVLVEFFRSGSDTLTAERHPLFEIQEAYEGKTLNLRIMSLWADSNAQSTPSDLAFFGSRFAVREFWLVAACKNVSLVAESIAQAFKLPENFMQDSNYFFPNTVYVLNTEGKWCGMYHVQDKEEYDALFSDILYLIDR